jgi:hypothetical protein
MNKLFLMVIMLVSLIACSPSTKLVKSWAKPGVSITQGTSNKVLVIGMVKDDAGRRVVEDQLVKKMKNAVASYTLVPSSKIQATTNADLAKIVRDGQFTHVLMLVLADIQDETYYVPGTTSMTYYGGYYGYYGYGASMYSTPGYYTTDKIYSVETTVYSVNPDELIWTGTTQTVNPANMQRTIDDVAEVVGYEMKKSGFLKTK